MSRHSYRIVVGDLERKRPIWFGGQDRSEASMAQFPLESDRTETTLSYNL